MIAALGFAGLRMRQGRIELEPHLPKEVQRLRFKLTVDGTPKEITVTREGWTIR